MMTETLEDNSSIARECMVFVPSISASGFPLVEAGPQHLSSVCRVAIFERTQVVNSTLKP